jgi:hypothetical protein
VVGILPNEMMDTVCSGGPFGVVVLLRFPDVKQHRLDSKSLTPAFEIGNFLDGAPDESVWVAGAGLKRFHMNMNVQIQFARDAIEERAIPGLAVAFATEKYEPARPNLWPASHPICGMAP